MLINWIAHLTDLSINTPSVKSRKASIPLKRGHSDVTETSLKQHQEPLEYDDEELWLPRTAYTQDLQHQFSNKSLTDQEHVNVMTTLAPSQARCVLDNKLLAYDMEINNLIQDKIWLQSKVRMLEQQLKDLQQSHDDLYRQLID